jgi:hypothetical protein
MAHAILVTLEIILTAPTNRAELTARHIQMPYCSKIRLSGYKHPMAEPIYKVIFLNQNHVYEVYAKHVYQSDMYGFIEIEEFVFGERSQMIVDPSEERLKNEFASVARSYIPIHSLVRIDEVEKEGVSKISDYKGENVTQLNLSKPLTPRGKSGDAD